MSQTVSSGRRDLSHFVRCHGHRFSGFNPEIHPLGGLPRIDVPGWGGLSCALPHLGLCVPHRLMSRTVSSIGSVLGEAEMGRLKSNRRPPVGLGSSFFSSVLRRSCTSSDVRALLRFLAVNLPNAAAFMEQQHASCLLQGEA